MTETNCSALPAAVEVTAIGETPSPSRSARSQSEKRRLRVDSKARAPTRRPGPGGQRPESRQSRAAGALSPPLRRFRHSGHSTAPAGCGHARVRVMMFSQAGRLPVPASCGAAPVGSLSSISLGAASDFARWNLSNVTHANSTGPRRAIFIQSPGACKFAPCPAAIGRALFHPDSETCKCLRKEKEAGAPPASNGGQRLVQEKCCVTAIPSRKTRRPTATDSKRGLASSINTVTRNTGLTEPSSTL